MQISPTDKRPTKRATYAKYILFLAAKPFSLES